MGRRRRRRALKCNTDFHQMRIIHCWWHDEFCLLSLVQLRQMVRICLCELCINLWVSGDPYGLLSCLSYRDRFWCHRILAILTRSLYSGVTSAWVIICRVCVVLSNIRSFNCSSATVQISGDKVSWLYLDRWFRCWMILWIAEVFRKRMEC